MKSIIVMTFIFGLIIFIDHSMITRHSQIKEINSTKVTPKQEEALEAQTKKHKTKKTVKKRHISQKKKKFFSLVVPAIENVHKEQEKQFERVKQDIQENKNTPEIARLKKLYRVTDNHDLLLALKPHPASIVIAQAAIESAWGTSRFFREANNIFGMWSKNPNEPRIAAGVKRNGTHTIWLKKFPNLDESIKQYYITIGRAKDYKEFRALRYKTNDVNKLVKKLDKYSELGDKYTKIISSVIKHNNLTKYDK